MQLTTAQLQTLKTWLTTGPGAGMDDPTAMAALNAAASPDYWVWRTAVPKREIVANVSQDGTSFIWAGNGFISRTVGELECWNQLFNSTLECNPTLDNVRQAFSDIFSGAGNAASNRAHLLVCGRRKATVGEKLFATGTGSTGSPAKMALTNGNYAEGEVTDPNITAARNLP